MGTWENCEAVERHPDRMSGAWVFRGTRVPIAALFENRSLGEERESRLTRLVLIESTDAARF